MIGDGGDDSPIGASTVTHPVGPTITGLRSRCSISGTAATNAPILVTSSTTGSTGSCRPAAEAVEQWGEVQPFDGVARLGGRDRSDEHGPVGPESASTPPAPTTTKGPSAGSRVARTSNSRPAGTCCLDDNAT